MNRIEKILEYFKKNAINCENKAVRTIDIANIFEIQRTDASAELNKLVKQGVLEKCGSKPVLYYLSDIKKEKKCISFTNIIGSNGSIKAQIDLAKAAISYPPHGLHTLICGESGVGKSLLAESMANYAKELWGKEKNIPFITFSCADYADNAQLLVSQLFGYVKGAFTGATEEHEGVLDRAQGGILFLDEIHRLPPTGQELLFILIDKGFYRRLGETKTEHKSNVMIIGATSENVDSSLLLTFKRRIPVQINLPSIMQRPIDERLKLIMHFFNQEAIRLNYPIYIEGKVVDLLLKYNCPANIGELKNDIVLCCAKGYLKLQAYNKKQLEITMSDLPNRIFTHLKYQTILDSTINQILQTGIFIEPNKDQKFIDNDGYGIDFYKYIDRKIENYRQLRMSDTEISNQVKVDLDQYFQVVMKNLNKNRESDIPTSIIEKDIWETANVLLEDAAIMFNRIYNRNILTALAWHLQQFKERVISGRVVYNTNLENIRKRYKREFTYVSNKIQYISDKLKVDVSLDELGFLAMFFIHDISKINEEKIGILVVAHGRSTAQNLAEVTNNLLGTEHIKAYNIPLNQNNTKTISDLTREIKKIDNGKGVVLLVDMGFLVTMEKILFIETGINVRIIPNVTTALVLEAGRQILTNENIELDEVIDNIYTTYDEYVATVRNQLTKDVKLENITNDEKKSILLICISGFGVAEKIRDILIENIPEINSFNLITAGINDNIENIYAKEKNNLCLVIGSVDPELPIIPFINIGDLFLPEGLNKVRNIITEKNEMLDLCIDKKFNSLYVVLREQISKFVKSLTPDEIAQVCEKMILKIVNIFFVDKIEQDTIVRLYLHLACMCDRINSKEALLEPEWSEDIRKNRKEEYILLNNIINSCINKINLSVPSGEIYYLLNSLPKIKDKVK